MKSAEVTFLGNLGIRGGQIKASDVSLFKRKTNSEANSEVITERQTDRDPVIVHLFTSVTRSGFLDGDSQPRGGAFPGTSVVNGLDGKIVLFSRTEFSVRRDHTRLWVDFEPGERGMGRRERGRERG